MKLGNWYVVDFDDHFTMQRTRANDAGSMVPIPMRASGKLVAITPKLLILEFGRRIDDDSAAYERSHWGILKSTVIAVHDLGTGSSDRKKRSRT